MILSKLDPAPTERLDDYASRFPSLRSDSEVGWEITIPIGVFFDTDLVNVTITPEGVYIENLLGDWDIIPFRELSQILDGAGCRNLDEHIDLVDPRLSLIARLNGTVVKQPGQPGYIVTGQQRIFTMLSTEDRSL